jgi:lipocalin
MKYQNNCRDRQKYQIAEAEGQSKYQILQKRKKISLQFFFFAETERKYQITETEEKKKYQNNYRDRTEIPNCRS